jgi:membrane protein required for colicin V production
MFIDTIFIILLILAIFKGYSKGLIVAVFSFLAIIIGLAAALKLSAVVAGWLQTSTNITAKWLPIIAFALVMFAVVFLVRLGAKWVQRTIEFALMGWLNKIGGIVLYIAIYTTVFSVVLFLASKIQLIKADTIAASKFYPFIQPWGPKAIDGFGVIIPIFKDLFAQLETFFDGIGKKVG